MADTKITALTALTGADPANDVIPIVDVNDFTMAASGTTKKISVNNILGAGGTATLASATITGDLTVDTNTLKVVAATDSVGVGFTPSAWGGSRKAIQIGSPAQLASADLTLEIGSNWWHDGTNYKYTATNPACLYSPSNGSHIWANAASGTAGNNIGWSTLMTLNSTGLGVGGSPVSGMLLTVGSTSSVSATANAFQILSNKGTFNVVTDGSTNAAGTTITYSWANGGQGPLIFRNASVSNVMTLDSSGNVISNVTSTAPTLGTNNQMVFNLTSNTNLRISVRGSDGTTRVANITLA